LTEPLFSLENVVKTFGSRDVLSIDRLDVFPGRFYLLQGRNGSGKTTLLKILAFLDSPSSGQLLYKGAVMGQKNLAFGRSQVTWSPQFPVMFSGSLLYNVEFPLKLKGYDRLKRRQKAYELLDLVSLTHLADASAPYLSGGEAQRASLARSLATGATVLLLDEPSANIDARSREELISCP
jgi:ABC-type sugar transport system ATPase subunit